MSEPSNLSALRKHYKALSGTTVADLFGEDPRRFERFSAQNESIFIDYSRNLITGETLGRLVEWLAATRFEALRAELLAGRLRYADLPAPVSHTLLRRDADAERERFLAFAERVRNGETRGATGKTIRDVVNLGIGGGHLGALLACEALGDAAGEAGQGGETSVAAHCVTSADARRLRRLLKRLDPETTLFVVSSRSFKTRETLASAHLARDWLGAAGDVWPRHFVAATSRPDEAVAFGLPEENCHVVPEGVTGRMSLWSAAGLVPATLLGRERFERMLCGAMTMDAHFAGEPPERNLPILLALLGVWHANVCGCASHAVLTYDYRLRSLPDYLQQLHMESNGKSAGCAGRALPDTAPVVWGGPGMDGQHAYFQMLHQGTWPVSCDFILTADCDESGADEFAHTNCFAQTRALTEGCDDADAERRSPGNRPSTTILLKTLDPFHFGMLVALYEHKVFTQSVLWGVNPFSQWGVELGKRIADELLPVVRGEADGAGLDPATRGMVKSYRAWRNG